MFGLGFASGLLILHLGITRPMTKQFARLQNEVSNLKRGVNDLVGITGQTSNTNVLLGALAEQGRRSKAATAALKDIEALQTRIAGQKRSTAQAHAALERLSAIREGALDLQEDASGAIEALERMAEVQRLVTEQYHSILAAQDTLAEVIRLRQIVQAEAPHLPATRSAVAGLIGLKDTILAESDGTAQAAVALADTESLHQRLITGGSETREARQATEDLLALKEEILCGSDSSQPQKAREALDEMVKVRERLHAESDSVRQAHAQLEGLLSLKNQVLEQTTDLAAAVETLEVAADLRRQFETTVQSFEQVRRWMLEFMLLEPTFERVAVVLKPLTELGNIRRLDPAELRQAARVIAKGRTLAPKTSGQVGPTTASAPTSTEID